MPVRATGKMPVLRLSGGNRPQLFRRRDNATVTLFGQAAEGQFEAAEIELRSFLGALTFVQHDNRSGFDIPNNSFRDLRWIATDRVEPAHRPADQLQAAPIELRMDEQIFQTGGRAKKMGRTIGRGPQQFGATIDFRCDPLWSGHPKGNASVSVSGDPD